MMNYMTKVFKLQKRALRIISNSSYLCHTKPLFEKYNTMTIFQLYNKELGLFMYKYKNGMLPISFDHVFTELGENHNYYTRNKTNSRNEIHEIKNFLYHGAKILEYAS